MGLTRRQFMKATLAAGVVAKFGGRLLADSASPSQPSDGLPRRMLGRTKEMVTILGLGGAYLARRVDLPKTRPSTQPTDEGTTAQIVEAALEGGVRYFDTSPDYFHSEERLGPLLKGVRDKIFLVTKCNSTTAKGAEEDLARSLDRLQTDHVDLWLQHCLGAQFKEADVKIMLAKDGSLEYFRKAKEKGLVRHLGLSIHVPHATGMGLLANAADAYDVIQPFINYVSRAKNNAEKEVVEAVAPMNLGVVAMKVLGGQGQLADDYDRAFRYALSVPGVACALVGCRTPEEIRRAIQAAKDFRPLSEAEMAETIEKGVQLNKANSPKVTMMDRHNERDFGGMLA